MGNTIYAHIVYACNKIELDLNSLFSPSLGHAHAVRKMYSDKLFPIHMIEQPELVPADGVCILEIKTSLWYKLLEIKMGYSKFLLKTPDLANVLDFFQIDDQTSTDQNLWNQFYQNIRDPSWPECKSFGDVALLPAHVRAEIQTIYQPPTIGICDTNWVSLLTIAYYDLLMQSRDNRAMFGGAIFLLDDYFNNNVSVIKQQVVDTLAWNWDDSRSMLFHQKAMQNNRRYIAWLDRLTDLFKKTLAQQVTDIDLDTWEKALWLAAACVQCNKHPKNLNWDVFGELNSNKELITIFKE